MRRPGASSRAGVGTRPWLEEHKVQAIAITAAILFGLSLLLFPPEEGGAEPAAPEEGPCAGYERTEDLP